MLLYYNIILALSQLIKLIQLHAHVSRLHTKLNVSLL